MKAKNGCCSSFALAVGRGVFALALVAFWQVGHAARSGDFGKNAISQNGKSTTIYPMGSINSGGSTIPVTPTVGGWTGAGNYGFPPQATGPTAGVNYKGQFADGGSPTGQAMKYPYTAKSTVPWTEVAKAVGTMGCSLVGGGAAALACALAVPLVMDWIGKGGGRLNPDTGKLERKDPGVCTQAPCFDYWSVKVPDGRSTLRELCDADAAIPSAQFTYTCLSVNEQNLVMVLQGYKTNGPFSAGDYFLTQGFKRQKAPSSGDAWLPASMDDIAPYMDVPSSGNVIGEILSQGGTIPLGTPTVTGPASIKGPESVTTHPDGSRTVQSTTNNYTTNGNTVTNISNVTTTTVYNTDNSVRSVNRTETVPTEEAEKEDVCKDHPESLMCVELGTADGAIPKSTREVSYTPESTWGGGSCPADAMWSSQTLGQTYKLIPWATVCGWAGAMRTVVLLLAAWAAMWIVMPGNTQVKPQ